MAIQYQTVGFGAERDGVAAAPEASVRYRVADVDVEIRGPGIAIGPLERAFMRLPRVPDQADVAVAIEVRREPDGWSISESFAPQARTIDPRARGGWLAMELANTVASEVAARSKFLIMHAAVLERNGEALAIAGRGFSGKSTLSTHLLSRGWRMLSDEYAFVEPITGSVAPYQKLMFLRSGVIPMIPSSFRSAIEQSPWYGASSEGLGFYAIDPALSYGERVWSESAQLRAVALLEGDHGQTPRVLESDPWSLVPEFQALVWKSDDLLAGLAKLASALRGVRVAVVRPGPPLATADALEAWFGGGPAR